MNLPFMSDIAHEFHRGQKLLLQNIDCFILKYSQRKEQEQGKEIEIAVNIQKGKSAESSFLGDFSSG